MHGAHLAPMGRRVVIVLLGCLPMPTAQADPGDHETGHVPETERALDLTVSLGAGFENFVSSALREVAGTGPSWNVRAAVGSTGAVRVEVTYAGSAQPLTAAAGHLMAHGLNGVLRVNFAPWAAVEPFVYLGAGWNRFHVRGMRPANIEAVDHVLELPLGLGVAYRHSRVMVDIRAGLTVASGADLLPTTDPNASPSGEAMHRFALRANIGIDL